MGFLVQGPSLEQVGEGQGEFLWLLPDYWSFTGYQRWPAKLMEYGRRLRGWNYRLTLSPNFWGNVQVTVGSVWNILEDYSYPSFSHWGRWCVPRGTRTEGLCFFVKRELAYERRSGKDHKIPSISFKQCFHFIIIWLGRKILSKYVRGLKNNFGFIMNLTLSQCLPFSNYTNNSALMFFWNIYEFL